MIITSISETMIQLHKLEEDTDGERDWLERRAQNQILFRLQSSVSCRRACQKRVLNSWNEFN